MRTGLIGHDRTLPRGAETRRCPRHIGGYDIIDVLGCGGMGTVWRGRHRLLEREAAIKVIRVERCQDDGARARFEMEARVTAALTSPHTIRVFDCGETAAGDLFYAMEILRGCDLECLVRRFGPLSVDRALYLLAQVCDAIAEVHERGLVHADIKPANLFACRLGFECDFAKVLDFGLTRLENSLAGDMARTADGLTWATPGYMAPETILGITAIDRRTDVYALGCVAYFLVTGHLVFEAGTVTEIVRNHLQTKPDPPSTRTECAIPRDLDDLILACLDKDPARRPYGAADLKRHIAAARSGDWTQSAAKRWWKVHLPEYAEPVDEAVWIPSALNVECDSAAGITRAMDRNAKHRSRHECDAGEGPGLVDAGGDAVRQMGRGAPDPARPDMTVCSSSNDCRRSRPNSTITASSGADEAP
jgi:serine/threonine protein kinase